MNIQEAYIKGLDDAENIAFEKLSKALNREDVSPFNNPKMESLRQSILNQVMVENTPDELLDHNPKEDWSSLDIVCSILNDEDYPDRAMTNRDALTIRCLKDLVSLCKKCIKKKTKDGLQMEAVLKNFETELTKFNQPLISLT